MYLVHRYISDILLVSGTPNQLLVIIDGYLFIIQGPLVIVSSIIIIVLMLVIASSTVTFSIVIIVVSWSLIVMI